MSPRRRLVLLLAAATVIALVAAAWVRAVGSHVAGGVAQDRPGPVVLVPGYGGATGSLDVLAQRLHAAGRKPVMLTLPGDGTGDLAEQARVLDATVARLLAGGAPSVDVVGYSAGGVVARLWARDHDGRRKARRVVTLGSPHHGTDVAALALRVAPASCPPACQQLAPHSALLERLNSGDETPDGPMWVTVWSNADEVVTPPATARLDGALNVGVQSVCADTRVTHGELPVDPLVQAIALRALGVAPPLPLGASDCAPLRALSS